MVVVASSGLALLYHTKHKMWSMLPRCPYAEGDNTVSVVDHDGQIIVCAKKSHKLSHSKVAEFDVEQGKWKQSELLTTDKDYVVLATSANDLFACKNNKLLSLNQRRWKEECSLHSVEGSTATVKKVQGSTATVKKLLVTKNEFIIEEEDKIYRYSKKSEAKNIVQQICNPPNTDSTLHVVRETLFAFGGRDVNHQPTSDVFQYNPTSDFWDDAGYMRIARYDVTVVTVSQGDDHTEVLIMGGKGAGSGSSFSSNVERCIVDQQLQVLS